MNYTLGSVVPLAMFLHTLFVSSGQVFSPRVYTSQGVPISVTGIAQVLQKVSVEKDKWNQNHLILTEVKINGANEDMIVAACEQFGDKSDEEVTKKEKCK